ncbi:MAG: PulJ/GspJ family protein, partial [Sporichthyaceae bacterium]
MSAVVGLPRRGRRDGGFTLPELLLAVSILATMGAVLVAMLRTGVVVADKTQLELARDPAVELLTAVLSADLGESEDLGSGQGAGDPVCTGPVGTLRVFWVRTGVLGQAGRSSVPTAGQEIAAYFVRPAPLLTVDAEPPRAALLRGSCGPGEAAAVGVRELATWEGSQRPTFTCLPACDLEIVQASAPAIVLAGEPRVSLTAAADFAGLTPPVPFLAELGGQQVTVVAITGRAWNLLAPRPEGLSREQLLRYRADTVTVAVPVALARSATGAAIPLRLTISRGLT